MGEARISFDSERSREFSRGLCFCLVFIQFLLPLSSFSESVLFCAAQLHSERESVCERDRGSIISV